MTDTDAHADGSAETGTANGVDAREAGGEGTGVDDSEATGDGIGDSEGESARAVVAVRKGAGTCSSRRRARGMGGGGSDERSNDDALGAGVDFMLQKKNDSFQFLSVSNSNFQTCIGLFGDAVYVDCAAVPEA